MKLLSLLFFVIVLSIDPTKIGKVNSLKSEAKKAYLTGDMKTAIQKYRFLKDSLGVSEEEIAMNLANAYFQTNDTTSAFSNYQPLSVSGDPKIKSWANQQMGVVSNRQGKFEEALNYFKQAMKAEPNNEQARFNYEMVKKKLEEKKKQDQKNKDNQDKKDDQNKDQNKDQKDQQNKDQQNKDQKDKQDKKDQQNKDQKDQQKKDQKDKQDQKDKEQKDKEQKEKEQQQKDQKDQKPKDEKDKKPDPSLSDKLKDMKISEEKAKMILEAMKNQEVQYLQQNKRKATKPKDKGKPDW